MLRINYTCVHQYSTELCGIDDRDRFDSDLNIVMVSFPRYPGNNTGGSLTGGGLGSGLGSRLFGFSPRTRAEAASSPSSMASSTPSILGSPPSFIPESGPDRGPESGTRNSAWGEKEFGLARGWMSAWQVRPRVGVKAQVVV